MKLNKNNKRGYLQTIISILIIFCTFIPYSEFVYGGRIHFSYSAMVAFSQNEQEQHLGIFFMLFILFHLVNILIQSKRNNKIAAIVAGAFGFFPILLMHLEYVNFEKELRAYSNSDYINYGTGFYFILILSIFQIITQIMMIMIDKNNQVHPVQSVVSDTITEQSTTPENTEIDNAVMEDISIQEQPVPAPEEVETNNTVIEEINVPQYIEAEQPEAVMVHQPKVDCELEATIIADEKAKEKQAKLEAQQEEEKLLEKERQEKEQLVNELNALKAKAEQIELERLEQERLEKERLEQEKAEKERIHKEKLEKIRLEKENLASEIAKLKEILKKIKRRS